ncbi:MAG: hypothetical protein FJX67_15830 [Alphaproteobacteria bacterium]|nr:hypothetical protein [Alphaproteobacteria bacterium]
MRTFRTLRLAILVAACIAAAPSAHAHAVLIATDPPDRANLITAPEEVTLRFNEPVRPIAVRILDGAGQPLEADLAIEDATVRLRPWHALAPGTYVVSWRVISADTHPVSGALIFGIGDGELRPAVAPTVAAGYDWTSFAAVNRWVLIVALVIGLGALVFGVAIAPAPSRRRVITVTTAVALAVASALVGIGIHGAVLLDAPSDALLEAATWHAGWTGGRAGTTAMSIAGIVVAALGDRLALPRWRAIAVLGGGATASLGIILTGHGATATPRWLAAPASVVHVIAVLCWIGALIPLIGHLRRGGSATVEVVRRFSARASGVVALLVVTGLVLAAIQIDTPAAILASPYGRLLLLKLALVGLLLALAAINRWRLTPRLARGEPGAASRLDIMIRIELAVAFVVLGLAVALAHTAPPRGSAGAVAAGRVHDHDALEPVTVEAADEAGRRAMLTIEPGAGARRAVGVAVVDADGRASPGSEATLVLAHAAAGIEPMRLAMRRDGPGWFARDDAFFPVAGLWSVEVELLIDDFTKTRFRFEVRRD